MDIRRKWSELRLLREAFSPSAEDAATGRILTYMLAERLKEVVAPDEFTVKTDGLTISVRGTGRCRGFSYSTAPSLLWNLPYPHSRRLELVCDVQSRDIQKFLTNARHRPWPSAGASAHVRVTETDVRVWWGDSEEATAVVRWRPLIRSELRS